MSTDPAHIWPTHAGDHRAANRSPGRGARHGVIRWSRETPGMRATLVNGGGRIAGIFERHADILYGGGTLVSRIEFPMERPPLRHVLTDRGMVVNRGSQLVALGFDGVEQWRHEAPGAVKYLHAPGHGSLVVWTRRSRHEIEVESDITRIASDGAVMWSTPHRAPLSGHVYRWMMASDDAGHLYALAAARMGDGVSGSDMPSGGVAAYDARGELAGIIADSRFVDHMRALARGVVLSGMPTCAYDERGARLWELTHDDEMRTPVPLPELGIALMDLPERDSVGLLAERGPGSYLHLNDAIDADGNRYFVHEGCVASVDASLRLRWMLRLPGVSGWSVPAIGPDLSLLVRTNDSLLAIE